jgi:hypothetical protein
MSPSVRTSIREGLIGARDRIGGGAGNQGNVRPDSP